MLRVKIDSIPIESESDISKAQILKIPTNNSKFFISFPFSGFNPFFSSKKNISIFPFLGGKTHAKGPLDQSESAISMSHVKPALLIGREDHFIFSEEKWKEILKELKLLSDGEIRAKCKELEIKGFYSF